MRDKDVIRLVGVSSRIYEIHDKDCNQTYGGELKLPYSFHLKAVAKLAKKYIRLINYKFDIISLVHAAEGHDLIEDARMTYNDVVQLVGKQAADIIYACTEEKGKSRSERHSDKFLKELAENRLAVYIKLCDIMANATFSFLTGSSMYEKYKSEFPRLKEKLYIAEEYEELWKDLEIILSLHSPELIKLS